MSSTLNFKTWSKTKNEKAATTQAICKRTREIEFEQDCPVGLGAMLDDGHTGN